MKKLLLFLVLSCASLLGQSSGSGGGVTRTGAVTPGNCTSWASANSVQDAGVSCGGSAPSFSSLTSGTNTGAAMLVGSGASLAASGSGTIAATSVPCSGLPALTGDTTTSAGSCATTTGKVNAVSYPSGPSTNTVPVVTSSNTTTYEAVPNAALATMAANTVKANTTASSASPADASVPSCIDSGGNHLNYTNGTGFSCGTTSSSSISGLTTNTITKASSATSIANSSVTDDGTNPTRAPNGVDTATSGDYEEYTVDTGGVTIGLALCVTANVDGNGRPKVLPCSHTAAQPGAGFVGIAQATVAAAGIVKACWTVNCSATFDNASTALNEAILSVTTDGQLHDTGAQTATAGQPNFAILNACTPAPCSSLVSLTGMLAQNPKGGGGSGKGVTANTTVPSIPYLSAANTYSDSPLFRFDANTIEQHNSTTAQTLNIYQSYSSSLNNHGVRISGSTISTFGNGTDVASPLNINSNASPLSLEVGGSPIIQLTVAPSIKMEAPVSVYAVTANPNSVGNTAGAGAAYIGGSVSSNAISTTPQTNTALTVGATTGATGPGDYWFVWMYQCQTAVAGAQVTGSISWTDRNSNSHSRSITLDCSSTANEVSASFPINVKASQTVSVTTTITNGGGTAAYDARFSAIQLN